MIYETKIAIAVREDLPTWQKVNATAFIAGGLAGAHPEIVGEPYRDADGGAYAPLLRQPVFVLGGDAAALSRARARAVERGVQVALYTVALFQTNNDADNRQAVACVRAADLDLVALGVYADRKLVDKIFDRLKLLQ